MPGQQQVLPEREGTEYDDRHEEQAKPVDGFEVDDPSHIRQAGPHEVLIAMERDLIWVGDCVRVALGADNHRGTLVPQVHDAMNSLAGGFTVLSRNVHVNDVTDMQR